MALHSPMGSPGVEVDPVSGRPTDTIELKKRLVEDRQARRVGIYHSLINDIVGEGGPVLQKVAALFVQRVDQIINEDPECKAYQSIFDSLGTELSIGKHIVDSKLEEVEDKAQTGLK